MLQFKRSLVPDPHPFMRKSFMIEAIVFEIAIEQRKKNSHHSASKKAILRMYVYMYVCMYVCIYVI